MTCGQHRAGDGSYLLYDKLNHIPCKRACDACRSAVDPLNRYEKEINWDEKVREYLNKYALFV